METSSEDVNTTCCTEGSKARTTVAA